MLYKVASRPGCLIQTKAMELHAVLFITYTLCGFGNCSLWVKLPKTGFQRNVSWQLFPIVLFIMVLVQLGLESVNKILKCDNSNESCWAVLSRRVLYHSVQVVVTFESGDEILKCEHSNASCCARMYYFSVVLFVCCTSWGGCWTFESMGEIFSSNALYVVKVVSVLDRRNLKCDPNERKIETLVKQRSFLISCLSCY